MPEIIDNLEPVNVAADRESDASTPRERPRGHVMRFTFTTGARPLEGYTIKRGIGTGGFGEVYYALSDAGKEVALKHIQRNIDVELRGVSQCLNLKHPNLMSLFDIRYDEAGAGWVVMEYIAGESLRGVIERNPNGMPLDQVNFWLAGVAAGVACLHDHGIVHRDLKPGNIFIDGNIVKVGDYGLSKFISLNQRSAQTESVGTFHYMAPEIGNGRYGREIDIYALGVVLFEMLTGRLPFDGESSQEIIMKHLTAKPDLTGLPQPYLSVIARSLEKDPDKRLGSVAEMLAMLNVSLPTASVAPVIAAPPITPPVATKATVPAQPKWIPNEVLLESKDTLFIDDDPSFAVDAPTFKVPAEKEIELGPVTTRIGPRPSRPSAAPDVFIDEEVEPIAKVVLRSWDGVGAWYSNPKINIFLKIVVTLAVFGLALLSSTWLVPVGIGLLLAYGLYYAVRAFVLAVVNSRKKAVEEEHRSGRRTIAQRVRASLTERQLNERLTELTGSMLVAAVTCGVLSVVIMIVAGGSINGSISTWGPQFAWLALATTASAWAVLIPTKFWEGEQGDQVLRRFSMLGVGLLMGALAFGIDSLLLLDMNYGDLLTQRSIPASLHLQGDPTLPAYLAFFGGLFVILRWWMHGDPLRSSRFSLWPIMLAGFWGFVLPFPQPWGALLAATISAAVQMSAPWISSSERTKLREQLRFQDMRA